MRRCLTVCLLMVLSRPASAAVREVGSGQTYTTIQACENAASTGDICNIHAGAYTETVTISGVTNLTFRNNSGESPVLTGRFRIQASATGTTITCNVGGGQMAITGYGTSVSGATGGIDIASTTGATATGCLIYTAYGAGIYVRNSTAVTVTGHTIYGMLNATGGIEGTGIVVNSSHSTDATYTNGTYVTNNIVHDNATDGLTIHGDYITVSGNTIYNNLTTSWASTHPDGIAGISSLVDTYEGFRHVKILKNFIKNHTQGIFLEGKSNDGGTGAGCEDVSVENNIIYADSGVVNGVTMDTLTTAGINIKGCKTIYVYHNTIGRHLGAAFRVGTAGGGYKCADGTIHIKNNIIANTLGYGFEIVDAADVSAGEFDYNLYYVATNVGTWIATSYATLAAFQAVAPTQEVHGVSGNPIFVNPATNDLDLGTGSPAINAATDVGITTDYAGVSRGLPYDIGAYEGETPLSAPATTYRLPHRVFR